MTESADEFEKSIHNPHDAAFRSAFKRKDLAEGFFRDYFPEEIIRHIDFDHMELGGTSYVDEMFKDSHSDIVYKTKLKNEAEATELDLFLYILFEHQSTPDPMMVFRLLCYMINIWKEYIGQNRGKVCLPPIFPAVLYHGKEKWRSPMTLGGLISGNEVFSKFTPDFTYQLYNLGDYPDEMLMIGDHMALNTVLYMFKHIFDEKLGPVFDKSVDLLGRIQQQDTALFLEYLEWVMRYTWHARNESDEEIRRCIESGTEKLGNDIGRTAMTIAERLRQEGMEKVRTRTGGIILKMIKKRFGSASYFLEQKLMRSDFDTLDQFGESIFDFNSLKDAEKWWEDYGEGGTA